MNERGAAALGIGLALGIVAIAFLWGVAQQGSGGEFPEDVHLVGHADGYSCQGPDVSFAIRSVSKDANESTVRIEMRGNASLIPDPGISFAKNGTFRVYEAGTHSGRMAEVVADLRLSFSSMATVRTTDVEVRAMYAVEQGTQLHFLSCRMDLSAI